MSEERGPLAYVRFKSRMEDASREGRLFSASSPQMIAIESDRLHRVFSQYKDSLGEKRGWIQSVVGTVSLIVGYLGVAEFKDFVLPGSEWRGVLITLICVMVVLSGREIARSWKAVTLDEIIEELIRTSNPVESEIRVDSKHHLIGHDIARRMVATAIARASADDSGSNP